MTTVLWVVLYGLWYVFKVSVFLGAFYAMFLAYSAIQEHGGWKMLPLIGKVCLPIPFVAFYLTDLGLNATVASAMFRQWPTKETITFSLRIKDLIQKEPTTWRGLRATKIAKSLFTRYTLNY